MRKTMRNPAPPSQSPARSTTRLSIRQSHRVPSNPSRYPSPAPSMPTASADPLAPNGRSGYSRFQKIERHTYKFVWSTSVNLEMSNVIAMMMTITKNLSGVDLELQEFQEVKGDTQHLTYRLSSQSSTAFRQSLNRISAFLVEKQWRQRDERTTLQRNKAIFGRLMRGAGSSKDKVSTSTWMYRGFLNDTPAYSSVKQRSPHRQVYIFSPVPGWESNARNALASLQKRYESQIRLRTHAMQIDNAGEMTIEDYSRSEIRRVRMLVSMYMSEKTQRKWWRAVDEQDSNRPNTRITTFYPAHVAAKPSRDGKPGATKWLTSLWRRKAGSELSDNDSWAERSSRFQGGTGSELGSRSQSRNTLSMRRDIDERPSRSRSSEGARSRGRSPLSVASQSRSSSTSKQDRLTDWPLHRAAEQALRAGY